MYDAQEEESRNSTFCPGCYSEKSVGLVVCWRCFKEDIHQRPAYKYFTGTFQEWLDIGKEEAQEDMFQDGPFSF